MQVHAFRTIIPEPFGRIQPHHRKKLLTSKIRYVFIQCMHARNANVTKVAFRVFGGLAARRLDPSFLILASLIVLLIIGRGAGTG
jgi:hypothetical protein